MPPPAPRLARARPPAGQPRDPATRPRRLRLLPPAPSSGACLTLVSSASPSPRRAPWSPPPPPPWQRTSASSTAAATSRSTRFRDRTCWTNPSDNGQPWAQKTYFEFTLLTILIRVENSGNYFAKPRLCHFWVCHCPRDLPDKFEAMPPRRKRRAAPAAKQQPPGADAPLQERIRWLNDQELERRTAAIKAIQAAETESVLSRLRLVQSYISKEQQETCALQYFQENLPNLSVVWNEKQNELELKWKDWDSRIFGDQRDDKILRTSIASLPTIGDLQFSEDSVQKNFIKSTCFDFNDFAWSEIPEGQMAGAADALQTPGAVSNRLSFGMTPKTVRLPKNGEMLLSVHGSPLGVYKEDNLAAIREYGNGSEDAAS